jgi:hypothetical protein
MTAITFSPHCLFEWSQIDFSDMFQGWILVNFKWHQSNKSYGFEYAGSGPKFELFDRDLSYRIESVIVVYLQVRNLSVISWTIMARTWYISMMMTMTMTTTTTTTTTMILSTALDQQSVTINVVPLWHMILLFLFRDNQSSLFLLNAACLAEKQQISIDMTRSTALAASTLTITPPMRSVQSGNLVGTLVPLELALFVSLWYDPIHSTRREHVNHYTTDAVRSKWNSSW